MPFKMKGSPLNSLGENQKEGIIKRALTSGKRSSNSVETSSQRQSRGIYTKAELASKSSNKNLSNEFTASLSKPGNKANNPFVNGVDTSVAKPTPQSSTTTTNKKTSTKKNLVRKKEVKLDTKQIGVSDKAPVGKTIAKVDNKTTLSGNIESGEALKSASKSKSRKDMRDAKKANKSSDAPKSKKEMRMLKASNKALKARETAASSTKMESRMAAGAKAKRLEKRAGRIAERIKRKNKK
tara:strand:+ start:64 stop:780 length:717 start_codon:yes stop_codon:yes gene_type:complete